jgi:tetratricopeptide (TPR) repeat protein
MYLKGSKWTMLKRRKRLNPWRIIILLLLVGAALYFNQVIVPATPPLFIPTPTPTRSPESYITDAEELLAQGKISLAIDAYYDAAQMNPRNASIYTTLAKLLIFSGDNQSAIENAGNALMINQNNSTAHALRGWALGLNGDYLDGEASLNRALEIDNNNAAAYAYLAEILILQIQDGQGELGTLDKAVENSRTAMSLSPNSLETHRARGLVLEQTGNYADAVAEFQAAVDINPNIADLHLALGRNYRYVNAYDKAVEEFNRANALNPSDPLPDTYISRTYLLVGEYPKAIQYAQQAVKDDPTDAYLYGNLGTMYYRNEQYQEAADALKFAISGGVTEEGEQVEGLPLDYGRISEYYQLYGLALARVGDCGTALLISRALQDGAPDDEYAVYNADEIVNICKALAENPPTPVPTATPEPTIFPTGTPQASSAVTETP